MSDDKMRAEFEAWWSSLASPWSDAGSKAAAWSAWQASLAALVVELPEQSPETPFSKHMVMDSSSVIEAIEAAGVRVKL